MLPIPFKNFIPKIYDKSQSFDQLANEADKQLRDILAEIVEMKYFMVPERIPSFLLDDLGYLLNAGLNNTDSDRTKRKKIATAIEGHKNRGLWEQDAKPKVDSIAGGDSKLLSAIGSEDWILVSDSSVPDSYDWGCLGAVETDCFLRLVAEGGESVVKGNIYIDVDNDSLTQSEIDQLVVTLFDVVPSYFRVFLGYIDGTVSFVTYVVIN